jgi:hypothetical protein
MQSWDINWVKRKGRSSRKVFFRRDAPQKYLRSNIVTEHLAPRILQLATKRSSYKQQKFYFKTILKSTSLKSSTTQSASERS